MTGSQCVVNVTQSENDEAKMSEIEVTNVTRLGQKAEPSDFELLKVLGQGSFGKVDVAKFFSRYIEQYTPCPEKNGPPKHVKITL